MMALRADRSPNIFDLLRRWKAAVEFSQRLVLFRPARSS
jgi:hypothetical protein